MSTIQRFLRRRERHSRQSRHAREESSRIISHSLSRGASSQPSPEGDLKKIQTLEDRIAQLGITDLNRDHVRYALQSAHAKGDVEKAFDLLLLLEDSIEGIIRGYTPRTRLLGAVNRCGVTCYMDALLFAMFARLDCFETILYKSFDDEPRRKLSILLRLWVNMLRSGKLITTDITKHLQDALAECGWEGAARLHQQDASEAFTFITEKLELPLLTLKMDIYHTGKEDASDDHKFINERLLEVAIPESTDGKTVTLEDCLESYFNNRIEVKRYMTRNNTLGSVNSIDSLSKGGTAHVEAVEVGSSASSSPRASSPQLGEVAPLSSLPRSSESVGAPLNKPRRDSIVRERFIPEFDENESGDSNPEASRGQLRKGTYRKEVMMPAWQFFSLIPWYTDNTPMDNAQVAAHFSTRRPILGMCLKRYTMSPNGKAMRLGTYIDIPTEIGLPHFIQDDSMDADGPLYGNFKLSLQALVCHRGKSVNSGHYIAIVRGTSAGAPPASADQTPSDPEKYWMRFDDLAAERVTLVDIEQALKHESPYLLFYQILPIDEDAALANLQNKPPSSSSSDETQGSSAAGISKKLLDLWNSTSGRTDGSASDRPSVEISTPDNAESEPPGQGGRKARSTALNAGDASHAGGPEAHTDTLPSPKLQPRDQPENGSSFSFRGSRPVKSNPESRAGSQPAENRVSTTFSRLTERLSRDKLASGGHSPHSDEFMLGHSPVEQTDEKSSGDSKEKGGRGRPDDPKSKGVPMRKSKSKSREKAGRVLERECVIM